VARGQGGDFDVVNVVDGDGNDFASGGDGTDDVCIIDFQSALIFGGPTANFDDFSDSCEFVYGTFRVGR
jgi:hypothetical protein